MLQTYGLVILLHSGSKNIKITRKLRKLFAFKYHPKNAKTAKISCLLGEPLKMDVPLCVNIKVSKYFAVCFKYIFSAYPRKKNGEDIFIIKEVIKHESIAKYRKITKIAKLRGVPLCNLCASHVRL